MAASHSHAGPRESKIAQRNGAPARRQHQRRTRRIGLRGAPVVAMHSHRALMARARQPYVGPSAKTVQGNLDRYGATYLDTWSNLRVLEDLIANCLVVGGTDLRLAALREGARTALLEWSAAMQTFADVARERAEVSERSVEQMLEVLGYPDKKARKRRLQGASEPDILTVLEGAPRRTVRRTCHGTARRPCPPPPALSPRRSPSKKCLRHAEDTGHRLL